jgi:hypothetical protein
MGVEQIQIGQNKALLPSSSVGSNGRSNTIWYKAAFKGGVMRACVCPTKPFTEPVHSSPWSAEKGADGPSAVETAHAPASGLSYL